MEILAERLLKVMNIKKMSQCALERKSGISQPSISEYVRGKTVPSAFSLFCICAALNISSDYLLGLSDEMEVQKCSAG